ncbi:MAG: hypothetical protein LBF72_04355 [Holosporales bacterium]|jgi:hypothetical protein|nr:hypothetical protein [Holosporales bacterium]
MKKSFIKAAVVMTSCFSFCWQANCSEGGASSPDVLDPLNQEFFATPTLSEQFRNVLLEFFTQTGLLPKDYSLPVAVESGQGTDYPEEVVEQDNSNSFASIQEAMGFTNSDVIAGGNVRQRIEAQTHTTESNSCKLCHIISSLNSFQKETRRNMNILMEELGHMKAEQALLKSLLLGHNVNVLKIIDSNGVSEAKFIKDLQTLAERIQEVLPPIGAANFAPYDTSKEIHHCLHSLLFHGPHHHHPHGCHNHDCGEINAEGRENGGGSTGDESDFYNNCEENLDYPQQ